MVSLMKTYLQTNTGPACQYAWGSERVEQSASPVASSPALRDKTSVSCNVHELIE